MRSQNAKYEMRKRKMKNMRSQNQNTKYAITK